ncbi:MAG: family 2 glycosyl transferase [Cyanobacteria bacterium P01_D01_bin.71]
MHWELCVLYANGTEEVLKVFQNLEMAQNYVDRIYAQTGYPMHIAYKVRPSGIV